ncbi:hypothetical protein NSTC731_05172 [Nostoc sp. DSM 114167]|jgi:hypothetical protein
MYTEFFSKIKYESYIITLLTLAFSYFDLNELKTLYSRMLLAVETLLRILHNLISPENL